jgi:hypothetical protein
MSYLNIETTSTESTDEVNCATASDHTVSSLNFSEKATYSVAASDSLEISDAPIVEPCIKPTNEFRPLISLEKSMPDDSESIVKHPRSHYEAEFNSSMKATALSTLKMCRTVYEAQIALDSFEFKKFCKSINQSDASSTIRKYIAIGKAYPRLVQYADQLARGWTTIYQITQIPAHTFDEMIKNEVSLSTLRGKKLIELITQSKPVKSLNKAMRFNPNNNSYTLAEVHAIRKLDIDDVRIIEKALSEVEARLPIRFSFLSSTKQSVTTLRMMTYENLKKEFVDEKTLDPEKWDLGHIANSVLPKEQTSQTSEQP